MDFDKALKEELFESNLQHVTKEIESLDNPTQEEKLRIIAKELYISDKAALSSKDNLKKFIIQKIEAMYNSRINCGGYAFKLDTCFFGSRYDKKSADECLDRCVSKILELIPFARLLGDTQLQDDEYLVEYRVNERGGHHFIRLDENGISDKNEANPPRDLSGVFNDEELVWGNLSNAPSSIFAVKKEHDIHHLKESIILSQGLSFEETAIAAIKSSNNEFEYHNKKYQIKADGKIYSNEVEVADIMEDGSEIIVVEIGDKHDFISNTKSSTYNNYVETIIQKQIKANNKNAHFDFDI